MHIIYNINSDFKESRVPRKSKNSKIPRMSSIPRMSKNPAVGINEEAKFLFHVYVYFHQISLAVRMAI